MRDDEYTPAVAARRAADKAQQSARTTVDRIVREHLKAVGFYDNRDGWAEETTSEMVDGLLVALGYCDTKGHDPIECSCELTEQDAIFHRGVVNEEAAEWRRVALAAWKHYRDKVWPSSNDVAHRHHAHHLAKMIPFLCGAVEEAWLREAPDGVMLASFSFNLREMNPDALAIITGLPVETVVEWTRTPEGATFGDARYATPEGVLPKRRPGEAYPVRPAWLDKGQHAYVSDPSVFGCAALYEHKGTHAYCGQQEDAAVHVAGVAMLRIECGERYDERTPACSIDASWPHKEHSNGEWHWRTPRASEPAGETPGKVSEAAFEPESVCKCPQGDQCGHAVRAEPSGEREA